MGEPGETDAPGATAARIRLTRRKRRERIMDAQSESGTSEPCETLGPRCGFDTAELRVILSSLSQELCRPLVSLRAGFDLLLAEASPADSSSRRGHVETMASLCDDLLRLTQGYLDYA